MIKDIQLRITLKEEKRSDILLIKAAHFLDIEKNDITGIKVLRKSIDARKPKIILNYKIAVYIKQALPKASEYTFNYSDVSNAKPVHIIGFGPAGMYAALRCIELGFKLLLRIFLYRTQSEKKNRQMMNQSGGFIILSEQMLNPHLVLLRMPSEVHPAGHQVPGCIQQTSYYTWPFHL